MPEEEAAKIKNKSRDMKAAADNAGCSSSKLV
jgi:hypothetical protein